mgnify:CR=1 FL=1
MQEPKHIRYAREYESQLAEVISIYEERVSEYREREREYERRQSLAAKTILGLSREVRRLTKSLAKLKAIECLFDDANRVC